MGVVGVKQLLIIDVRFRSYLDLQVVSLVLGFGSGNWTLTPYICSRLVGVEKLAEAHGILMLFGGVGLTLGPPVVGKMTPEPGPGHGSFFSLSSNVLFPLQVASMTSLSHTTSPSSLVAAACWLAALPSSSLPSCHRTKPCLLPPTWSTAAQLPWQQTLSPALHCEQSLDVCIF